MTEPVTGTAAEAGEPAALRWRIPKEFSSLGLEMEPAERDAYLEAKAANIWAGGTDHQRETVAYWYQQIARAAADDGTLEAAFCMLRTPEGRVTTATLSVIAEPIEGNDDVRTVVDGLVEALSDDPANQVVEVETSGGPGVLVLSGLQMTARQGAAGPGGEVTLDLAQASAYLPCLPVGQLVVLTLTTPSIQDFPDYVGVLAAVADSVEVSVERKAPRPARQLPADAHPSTLSVRDVFG
ncbi:hypothetical protein ACFYXS_09810 [Streptomyces sp. NPDC002574]|uniref:hypothetical protein n=1 Tax=Streptomyces sp. NPDC002574 TaxID=3364652 RepID=UPI003691F3D1